MKNNFHCILANTVKIINSLRYLCCYSACVTVRVSCGARLYSVCDVISESELSPGEVIFSRQEAEIKKYVSRNCNQGYHGKR